MKNIKGISDLLLMILVIFICSCEKNKVPVLSTSEVTDIAGSTATSGGTITDEGAGSIITKGVCWSTEPSPTTENSKTIEGEESETFTSNISGLNGATEYYVRAYATNSAGTGYGPAISFTTLGEAPAPVNLETTDIDTSSVTLNGTVNANHLSTDVSFEYGTTTGYGQSVAATPGFVTGNTSVSISANVTGLKPGTAYHFRIKAENSLGITYSSDAVFTTLGQVPSVSNDEVTVISSSGAVLNGTVNPNLLSSIVTFEYGTTASYGSSVAAAEGTISGSALKKISARLSGLNQGTAYHYRIKAENSAGISYSDDGIFITLPMDFDNNVYSTVTIGTQVWMGENLRTTMLNDGIPVDFAPDKTTWGNLTGPGYCWYDNNSANKTTYGALYNWSAVSTGKLCPAGWHVPTNDEWVILNDYLGGSSLAGGKLKESGTSHWTTPNTGAGNESGFTALPGGIRGSSGDFMNMRKSGYWWSSTAFSSSDALRYSLDYQSSGLSGINDSKKYGLSIRCIKDLVKLRCGGNMALDFSAIALLLDVFYREGMNNKINIIAQYSAPSGRWY